MISRNRHLRGFQLAGLFAFILLLCSQLIAAETELSIVGTFEGNEIPGRFLYHQTDDGLVVNYHSPSLNKDFSYSIANFDECSSMSLYVVPHLPQIVIDGSCSSVGGQIFQNVYQWNKSKGNWCLVREITGERPDLPAGKILPSEQIARVVNCPLLGESGPYTYEPPDEVSRDVTAELERFKIARLRKETLGKFLDSISPFDARDLAHYITIENVSDINDLVFYLSEAGRAFDALPVLLKITEEYPTRVVAKLNLADAYWENGYKREAKKAYAQYIVEMRNRGLDSKVPMRAKVRGD
ncbi:tetratricopeptide repeat protein [Paraburkholderia sp. J12]|uniref:tetratricopeptide repeat protein n=1 Tax=Paraburkholderia sp. J12 TaxID=2805432 RepID=UPI002ABD8ABB|nr:tetratricopeptide repeat protein [Paraburkholderia sp. J12]